MIVCICHCVCVCVYVCVNVFKWDLNRLASQGRLDELDQSLKHFSSQLVNKAVQNSQSSKASPYQMAAIAHGHLIAGG